MKPKLTRSFAPRTRPVAGAWRALIISSNRSSALAEIKEPPADNAAAPAVARAMNSRRVDFFAMRIVLPIVYFRRSISAQEKFAQKVKECLMARTLDLIRGYMFSHRTEPRGAGTGSDQVLTKFFTRKPCPYRKFHLGDQVRGDGCFRALYFQPRFPDGDDPLQLWERQRFQQQRI